MMRAPWTAEQVAALNRYQQAGEFHPYTCGNDGCRTILVAGFSGWVCPEDDCDYTQNWAHVPPTSEDGNAEQ